MQPVKVVPDGPPVPAVLVSKGHGVTRNDYSPPSYNAPKPVYQAPKPTYDKPKYDGYGAPKANGAAPTSYSPPKPTYNAPSPTYGAPKPSYQPPPSGLDSYSAPKPSYNAPSSGYGAPKPTYNAPSSSYGAPKPTYNAPSSSYGVPKPTYNAPYSSLSKSDSNDHVGIKRESVDHHGHAPIGHDHGHGHGHNHNHNHDHNHNHGHDQGQRQGRLEECICMPAGQCPTHSVMPFGGGHGLQQNAPLRQDVTPLQDYSGLIDPRIKTNSDIVAAGEHDKDDTIDLDAAIDDKIDGNRAR